MDRRSTRSTMVLFAAALAFAAWGCGSDKPNYNTGDGGNPAQHDAQHDGEPTDDAKHDAHHESGPVGDGGEEDAAEHTPTVTITAPAEGAVVKDVLEYAFTVTDDLDGLKAVAPEVLLDGRTLTTTLTAPATGDNSYEATGLTIDLTAEQTGPHTLAIRAWDTGDKLGVGLLDFVLDRGGPTFADSRPASGELVTGTITFSATVTDPAGVDDSTVTVEIRDSGQAATVPLFRVTGDTFQGTYPANMLWTDMVWPLLLWRAKDKLGNESLVAYEIGIDNVGPLITLDSPNVYLSRKVSGVIECSRPIDPLSNVQRDEYLNLSRLQDGARLPQLMFTRARVEDYGNWANGAAMIPVSGVDESTVKLYVRPLDPIPLVKSSNGICKTINTDLHEVSAYTGDVMEVVVTNLAPIKVGGEGDFRSYSGSPPPPCEAAGDPNVSDPPDALCQHLSVDSQANYVLGQTYDWGQTAIFGVAPVVDGDDLWCEGIQFDARQLPDGWMCVAVAARDKLGNLGVSKPLRVCLDKKSTGVSACNQTPADKCADVTTCEIPCYDPPNCLWARPFTYPDVVDLDKL
jgi:hypothetical protein